MTRRSLVEKPRLIKFVGDPVLVKEDGFGVPNWTYENNRVIAEGRNRILRPGDAAEWVYDENGIPVRPIPGTGIDHEYIWDKRNLSRVIEVSFSDAQKILARAGDEFKDVTDISDPEPVRNDVIVVKSKKKTNAGVARA